MSVGVRRRDAGLIAILSIAVAALFAGSLAVGPVLLPPQAVAAALVGQGSEAARIIVGEIRLPRAILALLIGGSLGLSARSDSLDAKADGGPLDGRGPSEEVRNRQAPRSHM